MAKPTRTSSTRIDLKKTLKDLYHPKPQPVVEVDVPPLNYLMIDGHGAPASASFAHAIEALFSVAYTLKFAVKKGESALDYAVMPLEGLWWADDHAAFTANDRDQWRWTLLILQPDFITSRMVQDAIAAARKKKPSAEPMLSKVRFEAYTEGRCAQVMHIGPFSAEGPTVARVHAFIEQAGHTLRGKHHEIYLSDFRKADPQKLKTIIRQPFE